MTRHPANRKKRDAEALQALGTELIALSHDSLKKLQLPENLYLAIREAQKITANGAIHGASGNILAN